MAPEQVDGQPGDHRADIFAFGCVLYEMLAGQKAFQGNSAMTVIAAIMSTEPAPIAALAATHPIVDHVLRRCLEKSPDRRWQDIGDVTSELQWAAAQPVDRTGDAAVGPDVGRRAVGRCRRRSAVRRCPRLTAGADRRIEPAGRFRMQTRPPGRCSSKSPRRRPTTSAAPCRRTARRSPSSPSRITCPCSGSGSSTGSRASRCRARRGRAFRSGRPTTRRSDSLPTTS